MSTEQQPAPVSASRRDRLSLWSVVLIIVYFVSQGLTMSGITLTRHHKALPSYTPPARSALDSDSGFQGLFEVDYLAKTIYISDYFKVFLNAPSLQAPSPKPARAPVVPQKKPSGTGTPSLPKQSPPKPQSSAANQATPAKPKPAAATKPRSLVAGSDMTLPDVVKRATDLLRSDPLDVDFARRVILLRAEAGMPPLAPIPATKKKPGLSSPLASYASAPGTPSRVQTRLDAEAAIWKELFSTPTIAKGAQEASLARRIEALQSLRWYKEIALHQLYLRAGDEKRADGAKQNAMVEAMVSIIPMAFILLAMLAFLCLGGAMLLAILIANAVAWSEGYEQAVSKPGFVAWLLRLGRPRAAPVPDEGRRLGAGDLMDVFVFYLFSGKAIGYLFEYLVGHPFRRQIEALSYNGAVNFDITAEFFAYILNGLLAYRLLIAIARRRKASVSEELGLSSFRLSRNALFGVVGWSMGLALMTVISLMSNRVFQRAPEPTNPAVSLEVAATGFLSHIMLFALVSIAAPFFEELLFRGVFFQAARLKLGPWPAIVLTGLVFGFAHPVGAGQAMALSTLGGVFAWMAYTRKSLVPSMTGHFLQNSFSSLIMWLAFW